MKGPEFYEFVQEICSDAAGALLVVVLMAIPSVAAIYVWGQDSAVAKFVKAVDIIVVLGVVTYLAFELLYRLWSRSSLWAFWDKIVNVWKGKGNGLLLA